MGQITVEGLCLMIYFSDLSETSGMEKLQSRCFPYSGLVQIRVTSSVNKMPPDLNIRIVGGKCNPGIKGNQHLAVRDVAEW